MCKYCKEGSKLSRGEIQSQIIKDGYNHYIESIMFDSSIEDYTTERVRIFFCPICGQDLLALDQRDADTILLSRLGQDYYDIVGLLADNSEESLLEALLMLSNIKLTKVKTMLEEVYSNEETLGDIIEGVAKGIISVATSE